MVQVHAAHAGMSLTRSTVDVDMILHIETGAATFSGIREQLETLGYAKRTGSVDALGSDVSHTAVYGHLAAPQRDGWKRARPPRF